MPGRSRTNDVRTVRYREGMRMTPQAFIRDQDTAVVTLDPSGTIVDCDGSVERMFGYTPEALIDRDIASLIPQLKEIGIMREGEVNGLLKYLCHIGAPFEVRHRERGPYESHLLLVDLRNAARRQLRMFVRRDA